MKKIKEFILGMAWMWMPLVASALAEGLCKILL